MGVYVTLWQSTMRVFRLSSGVSERKVEDTLNLKKQAFQRQAGEFKKNKSQDCLGSCISLCLDKEEGKNKNHTFFSKVFFGRGGRGNPK